ncbi:MAG: type II toxin-antitoxin system VapC family toxin [Terriglobia bacterium]
MVIDTSALVAIFLGEPERQQFLEAITQSGTRRMSAANVLEAGIVLEARRGEAAGQNLDVFLQQAKVEIVPVDAEQAAMARRAWRKFGKGRHPAALNFGDCFAYALAKFFNEPLLAKGNDFIQTDIKVY